MALSGIVSAASFSDPTLRGDLQAYYDKMKSDAVAAWRARPEMPAGPVKMRDADGRVRDVEAIAIPVEKMEQAFVSFDTWLEIQSDMYERYEDGPVVPEHRDAAAAGEAPVDFVYDGWQESVARMNTFLLGLQEVREAGESDGEAASYDFADMTRGEIADAGKKLFNEGKITLDELFRFEHPDGRLRIGLNGERVDLDPHDKIDFIAFTRKAISDMEATGEALRPDSGYKMFVDLLDKLLAFKA